MRYYRKPHGNQQKISPLQLFCGIAVIFILGIVIVLSIHYSVSVAVSYVIAVNAIMILLLGWDKLIASSTYLRVPERCFYFLAFCGGSLAGLLGQVIFHHKIRKMSFQVVYWLVILVQVVLLWVFIEYIDNSVVN